MVDRDEVAPILNDAARLVGEGEIVVFGSAALALWLRAPLKTRDVDVWCEPREKGDVLTAVMGEQSWYHAKHGTYVEVWGPETFAAPRDWRERARIVAHADLAGVRLVVPHPHDVLVSKLERMEPKDRAHVERILDEYPIEPRDLDALVAKAPHRDGRIADRDRVARFEAGAEVVRRLSTARRK